MKLLVIFVALLAVSTAKILEPLTLKGVIPGKYIVKLKDGVKSENFVRSATLRRNDGVLSRLSDNTQFVYRHALNGFAVSLDDSMLRSLDAMAEVDWIEPDMVVTVDGQVQSNAAWGLARTSSRPALSGSSYTYYYEASSGDGSTVYVIDTGILTTHTEFGGRAVFGFSSIADESNEDLHGHGTHVAGTVGGNTYGIAKKVTLVAVKVLNRNGSGTNAGVVAGIDWVTANAPSIGAVINMSLGGGVSTATDTAVANAVSGGVTVAVSAGNSAASACNQSPARAPEAITVAASDVSDRSATFTNFGDCVDIYAPGVQITSAWIGSNTATSTISGTSMASPHVAGLAAYFITRNGLTSPAAVVAKILEYVTTDAISAVPAGTPNRLIYNGGNGVDVS